MIDDIERPFCIHRHIAMDIQHGQTICMCALRGVLPFIAGARQFMRLAVNHKNVFGDAVVVRRRLPRNAHIMIVDRGDRRTAQHRLVSIQKHSDGIDIRRFADNAVAVLVNQIAAMEIRHAADGDDVVS